MVDRIDTNQPTVQTGGSATTGAVIRTGLQALTPTLILEGFQVFNVWHPTADQMQWLITVGTPLTAWLQWRWEIHRGRKLIGKTV
jgi:hypothetical protein